MWTRVIVTWTRGSSCHCLDDLQLDLAEKKLLRYQIKSTCQCLHYSCLSQQGSACWEQRCHRYTMTFFQHSHSRDTHSVITCRPLLCPESSLPDSSISYVKENRALLNVRPAHQRILTARLDLGLDLPYLRI